MAKRMLIGLAIMIIEFLIVVGVLFFIDCDPDTHQRRVTMIIWAPFALISFIAYMAETSKD